MKYKANNQVWKYRTMLNYTKLSRQSIEESTSYLMAIIDNFNKYEVKKMKVMRTELHSLVEVYKQSSIITSIISAMVAIAAIIATAMRDLLLIDKSDPLLNNILYFGILIVCSVVFFPAVTILYNHTKNLKIVCQILGLVELAIEKRAEIDKHHGEAYQEYSKYLKEGSPIT